MEFKSIYTLELNDRTVELRLPVAAQIRLKNKYKEETLDTIISAPSDPEKLIQVFNEALQFKGNHNEELSGEELYDLLVDNGTKGIDKFAEITYGIANASGILSDDQQELITEGVSKSINAMFDYIANSSDKVNEQPVQKVNEQPVQEEAEKTSFPG